MWQNNLANSTFFIQLFLQLSSTSHKQILCLANTDIIALLAFSVYMWSVLRGFFKIHIIKYSWDVFIFRELQEESGLTVDALEKVGNIKFEFVGEPQLLDVHVFRADAFHGEPTESEGLSYTAPHCFWTVRAVIPASLSHRILCV